MKTKKWFSLEWNQYYQCFCIYTDKNDKTNFLMFSSTIEAYDWLEQNGYIERTKEDERIS